MFIEKTKNVNQIIQKKKRTVKMNIYEMKKDADRTEHEAQLIKYHNVSSGTWVQHIGRCSWYLMTLYHLV